MGAVMWVAARWQKRPSEIMEWTESELALCLAQLKREQRDG